MPSASVSVSTTGTKSIAANDTEELPTGLNIKINGMSDYQVKKQDWIADSRRHSTSAEDLASILSSGTYSLTSFDIMQFDPEIQEILLRSRGSVSSGGTTSPIMQTFGSIVAWGTEFYKTISSVNVGGTTIGIKYGTSIGTDNEQLKRITNGTSSEFKGTGITFTVGF